MNLDANTMSISFKRVVYLSAIATLSVVFATSCSSGSGKGGANANASAEKPPIQVTVGRSIGREIGSTISASGSLVAEETSDVAPKVAGKVVSVSINVGDFVGAGQTIAKVDDREVRYQVSIAQAAVNSARSAVRQAEARLGLLDKNRFDASVVPEVRAANANYEQAQAELRQAEANEKRYRELKESGDVAEITYEQFKTARDTANSRANNAKQQLEAAINTAKQSNQAILTAQAGVQTAITQLENAQRNLADTSIKAPFGGYVSARPVAVGEFVSTSSVIATILRTNPMKAQIQIAEADVPYIVGGRGVSLEVDAYKDRKFAGTVSAVNPAVDPTSRSAMVEALVENNGNLLRSGMFVQAKITREGGTSGVFVPKSAVYNDASTQSQRVFVIVEGVAKLKTVQLGVEEGDMIQIVTGVDADQNVATSNLDQLYEGAKVSS
ncbi:MAG: efflux RND transporter periplasmic adaptor subunit [Blastocatellia bacterium]|nr:efflux RND transporter periplasmic adaptor subunit [Blastocatellia bacterium]